MKKRIFISVFTATAFIAASITAGAATLNRTSAKNTYREEVKTEAKVMLMEMAEEKNGSDEVFDLMSTGDRLQDPDQTRDRDRLKDCELEPDMDQTRDRDQLKDCDNDCDKDQDRDRDRLKDCEPLADQDQTRDRDRIQDCDNIIAAVTVLAIDESKDTPEQEQIQEQAQVMSGSQEQIQNQAQVINQEQQQMQEQQQVMTMSQSQTQTEVQNQEQEQVQDQAQAQEQVQSQSQEQQQISGNGGR